MLEIRVTWHEWCLFSAKASQCVLTYSFLLVLLHGMDDAKVFQSRNTQLWHLDVRQSGKLWPHAPWRISWCEFGMSFDVCKQGPEARVEALVAIVATNNI